MNALWLEDRKLSYREDIPDPKLKSGFARLRVHLAGVCATDLELLRGYYPFTGVPGHEFVARVVEASQPALVGKRVVGEINLVCGRCVHCNAGRPTHCIARRTLGIKGHPGAFAEYVTLPLENLHCVPDSVPDEVAVFTEPLAAALEILEQVHIHPDDSVLVVGAGRLGQLVAQVLALTGCALQVVARHASQQEILRQRGIGPLSEEQVSAGGWDVVVDATGSPGGFALARRAVRSGGTLVLKSTFAAQTSLNLSSLVVDEITLIGSRCGPFPPALRLLEQRMVDPTPLISARYPLSEGVAAFEKAGQTGSMKVLLEI